MSWNDIGVTQDPVVIVSSCRTPIGSFQGVYSHYSAPKLGANVISDLILRVNLDKNLISEVIMGCVLPAGLGQAPARQAALGAGLSNSIPCTTVNKMCGSGLKTIALAYNNILADKNKIIIAGGMENMSLAPYLIPKARSGLRLGHGQLLDHMFYDGLEDAYTKGLLMGHFAERTAKKYNFSREAQDEFAISSVTRAQKACNQKLFKKEITAIKYDSRGEQVVVDTDEIPENIKLEKIAKLKPAFVLPGEDSSQASVTAANSSSIADGASDVLLMRKSKADELGLNYQAKIKDYSEIAHEPEWFTTAPVSSINRLLDKTGMKKSDIDLFEINEAFAVVTMVAINDLDLDHHKVNIYGGACALGHPIGATGSRIVTTLLNSLEQEAKQTGIASLCIGGGEAMALAVERI